MQRFFFGPKPAFTNKYLQVLNILYTNSLALVFLIYTRMCKHICTFFKVTYACICHLCLHDERDITVRRRDIIILLLLYGHQYMLKITWEILAEPMIYNLPWIIVLCSYSIISIKETYKFWLKGKIDWLKTQVQSSCFMNNTDLPIVNYSPMLEITQSFVLFYLFLSDIIVFILLWKLPPNSLSRFLYIAFPLQPLSDFWSWNFTCFLFSTNKWSVTLHDWLNTQGSHSKLGQTFHITPPPSQWYSPPNFCLMNFHSAEPRLQIRM